MIKESKHGSDVMKKYFNKQLAVTKKGKKDLEYSIKCQICENAYVDNDFKDRSHYHITGKYRDSLHGDFHIKVRLIHKDLIVFHSLNNYDSHYFCENQANLILK